MIVGIKRSILQWFMISSILGALYWYWDNTAMALRKAEKQVDEVKADRVRLEGEVKELKEQSKIDQKTSMENLKAQGASEVQHEVAIVKVQHEVKRVLQEAPVESRGSPKVADAVSSVVIDGMWDSYNHSVRGETLSPTK